MYTEGGMGKYVSNTVYSSENGKTPKGKWLNKLCFMLWITMQQLKRIKHVCMTWKNLQAILFNKNSKEKN